MFEDYVADVDKYYVKSTPEPIQYGVSPHINQQVLFNTLYDIDAIQSNELDRIITESYSIILSKEFIKGNKNFIARLFTNTKFVVSLTKVLGGVREFTAEQKTCCNKLIYDYFILPHNKNGYVESLLYNLGMSINKAIIPVLLGIGLDQSTSHNLAIARYSTDNLVLATKRVNVIIVNSSVQLMTEQRIIDIYQKLFDNLMPLFEGIMFDKWDDSLLESDQEKEEIYTLINLALLDILNEMPKEMIVHILNQYHQLRTSIYQDKATRFNIHAISYDYERIIECIDQIEAGGFIKLPV